MSRKRKLKNGTRDYAKPKSDVSLARWDQGADGPANRIGLVTEERGDIDPDTGKTVNPNSVKGMRREDAIDEYLRRGWLSKAQHNMATRLVAAFEATHRTAPAIKKVQVDSSPKPDAFVAIMIDRISKLSNLSKRIPVESIKVMRRVLYDGATIEEYTGGDPMEVINAAAALSFGLNEMVRSENENI